MILYSIGFSCNGMEKERRDVTDLLRQLKVQVISYKHPLHPRPEDQALLVAQALIKKIRIPYNLFSTNCEVVINKIFINSDRLSCQTLNSAVFNIFPERALYCPSPQAQNIEDLS